MSRGGRAWFVTDQIMIATTRQNDTHTHTHTHTHTNTHTHTHTVAQEEGMVRDGSDHDRNECDYAEITKGYDDILDEIEELSPASWRGGEGGGEMEGGFTEIEVLAQCTSQRTHARAHTYAQAHAPSHAHMHTKTDRQADRQAETHTHAHTRTHPPTRAHTHTTYMHTSHRLDRPVSLIHLLRARRCVCLFVCAYKRVCVSLSTFRSVTTHPSTHPQPSPHNHHPPTSIPYTPPPHTQRAAAAVYLPHIAPTLI